MAVNEERLRRPPRSKNEPVTQEQEDREEMGMEIQKTPKASKREVDIKSLQRQTETICQDQWKKISINRGY